MRRARITPHRRSAVLLAGSKSRLAITCLMVAGCSNPSYMVVSIDVRPAVHDPQTLKVTLSNAGTTRGETFPLGSHMFPVTFAVDAPGRSGALDIVVDATDTTGALVGHGETMAPITATTANVMVDGADFVINTDYAGDQFLSDDYEAIGLQLAATTDGTWLASFRDSCNNTQSCNVFGRRFDKTGLPASSAIAAGTNAFPITTVLTQSTTTPAVASTGTTTMVFWDYADTADAGQGVACRAIDATGNALPGQLSVATEAADVVTAAPLSNGNFAVTWQTFQTNDTIRETIVKPDCTPLVANSIQTVSTALGMFGARRSHVVANAGNVLYAWIVDGDVHIRTGKNDGTFVGTDTTLIPHTTTPALQVDHVRIAPMGTGFAVVVRWADPMQTPTVPGKIELYRVTATGTITGNPTLITDQSRSDFLSDESFGVAARSDGALMIVWHACSTGQAGSCDVFGRIVRPSGVPVGDPFGLATQTSGDQTNPSVIALPDSFAAAWDDSSDAAVDTSGLAVRGRILYPAYDDATAVLGADCSSGKPACGMGLVCAAGSDSMQRCYESCMSGGCPHGGTCDQSSMACTF